MHGESGPGDDDYVEPLTLAPETDNGQPPTATLLTGAAQAAYLRFASACKRSLAAQQELAAAGAEMRAAIEELCRSVGGDPA